MTTAARYLLVLLLVLAPAARGQQSTPAESATDEAVRRQEGMILLRKVLASAAESRQKQDLAGASRLYEEAYRLVLRVGVGIDAETQETISGLSAVRVELARQAQRRKDFQEAALHLSRVLAVDPKNPEALKLKKENDLALEALQGRTPSKETLALLPEAQEAKIRAGTLVQDGKLRYEMGYLDQAEVRLKEAIQLDPKNEAAYYYLKLIDEARYAVDAKKHEIMAKNKGVEMEKAWLPPTQREQLPTPNPLADTYVGSVDINQVHTGPGRNAIQSKLHRIVLNEVNFDGLPLPQVLQHLADQALQRDPDKLGINFLLNPNVAAGAAPPPLLDPTTGNLIPAPAPEPLDMNNVMIRINPPLRNLRLIDVLEAVVKVADKPIKYSIEEYAVVISQRPAEATTLETRIFKINPNTFIEGLNAVGTFPLGNFIQSNNSGGGGGGQGGGGGGGGGGLPGVTSTNLTQAVQDTVRAFFTAAGVNMLPPNQLYFNDRTGVLMVRATSQELDIIQKAIEVLNVAPPQLTIEAKFVEIGQEDSKALGFDWFLGNTLMKNGSIGMQGGTAPSFAGSPSTANPGGTFPGSFGIPTFSPAATDGQVTSGLRSNGGSAGAASIMTITGILTDPQFRVVIRAIENRSGTDLMAAPKITTLSGRQTQIQVVDIRTIVTGNNVGGTTGGGGAGVGGVATGGGGAVGGIQPTTAAIPFGPVLDVIPYVSADGYSIQMTLIPSITEFLGYDTETAKLFTTQLVLGSGNTVATPIEAQLPLPMFRSRQVVTSCNVWDGQTVVLGGLLATTVEKVKDKIPVIGDLPFVGRLFRSEGQRTRKKNLLIFVTPTIIDPAGNPVHTPDYLPYDPNAVPPQMPVKQ